MAFTLISVWIESAIKSVAESWHNAERLSILKKYQKLLSVRGSSQYQEHDSIYTEVAALVKLRNALTHFKSEWDDAQLTHADLENLLKDKFQESYFSSKSDTFIPNRCFGAGCANWAVETAIAFIKDVRMRLGLSDNIPMEEARAYFE